MKDGIRRAIKLNKTLEFRMLYSAETQFYVCIIAMKVVENES